MSLLNGLWASVAGTDDSDDTAAPGADAEKFDTVSSDLDIGDALDLLRNSRRRQVIKYVWTQPSGETDIGDLAEHIAAAENGCTPSEVTSDQRKRVYIALYQNHLEKLDRADVVDWEQDRGTVEINTNCDPLAEALDQLEGRLWGGEV